MRDETSICKVLDPWGGSYYVEALTQELIKRSWGHVQEVEELGGRQPRPSKRACPRCTSLIPPPARRQRIDSGKETVVGRNKYRLAKEEPPEILDVDDAPHQLGNMEEPREKNRLPGHNDPELSLRRKR
uniref:Methylmalonyl-CoA mutase n=1 Tax=Candidatus Kentrum sp. FW TaxID=2126338 RepID=A0A450SR80_9GAMM|nr:MAG: methylmalonyl-CoA mutase [Candidatus Kentron sp. FW]